MCYGLDQVQLGHCRAVQGGTLNLTLLQQCQEPNSFTNSATLFLGDRHKTIEN